MGRHLRRFLGGFHNGKCDFPYTGLARVFTVFLTASGGPTGASTAGKILGTLQVGGSSPRTSTLKIQKNSWGKSAFAFTPPPPLMYPGSAIIRLWGGGTRHITWLKDQIFSNVSVMRSKRHFRACKGQRSQKSEPD